MTDSDQNIDEPKYRGGDSPESVAFDLMLLIAHVNKPIPVSISGLLDLYAECRAAVNGRREFTAHR